MAVEQERLAHVRRARLRRSRGAVLGLQRLNAEESAMQSRQNIAGGWARVVPGDVEHRERMITVLDVGMAATRPTTATQFDIMRAVREALATAALPAPADAEPLRPFSSPLQAVAASPRVSRLSFLEPEPARPAPRRRSCTRAPLATLLVAVGLGLALWRDDAVRDEVRASASEHVHAATLLTSSAIHGVARRLR